MKKFIFSLQRVLDYKKQTLDVEVAALAALQKKLMNLENEIAALNLEFAQTNQRMADEMREGFSPNRMAVYKNYLDGLNKKTQRKLLEKKQLLEQISKKKQEVLVLKSGVSGLEKLEEHQRKEYNFVSQKHEEKAVEEFVGRQYQLKNEAS